MSVDMWNCHSSSLDVSNNLSGYCISNLVLVSTSCICMCIYELVFPYIFLLVDCFEWALIGHIEKCRVHFVLWQFWMGGGSICKFYFSLYFPFSGLFLMGSHWSHWKAKSSLCPLAVLNGGVICLWYLYVFSMHWYFLIFSYNLTMFEWALIGNIEQWRVHSVDWQFQMGGGRVHQFSPPGINLKMWAHFKFCSCFMEALSFL